MSSLLEQAIIDAKVLMETARKNAEAEIIKKYEPDIQNQIKALLEQDDPSMDVSAPEADSSEDIPPLEAAPVSNANQPLAGGQATPQTQNFVDKVPASYLGEDNMQEIEINLDSIVEKIDEMQKELNVSLPENQTVDSSLEESSDNVTEEGCGDSYKLEEEQEDLEEEYKIDEELVMDLSNVSAGGVHANETELRRQHDIAKALEAQNAELLEQLKLKDEQFSSLEEKLESIYTNLKETKNKLKKSSEINVKLKESFEFLSKKVTDVNTLNARLLYTNKILGNSSLNERQKQQIAESISKSKTVEEARTIYNTLQKSAGAVFEKKSAPQSLTEAVNRNVSPFLPRNNTVDSNDPMKDRWQRIAGIKK